MARGGKRENAGRKSTGRKHESFYINENEKKILKAYLEYIRNNPLEEPTKDEQYVVYLLSESVKFQFDSQLREERKCYKLFNSILPNDSTSTDSNEDNTTNKVCDERNDILELIDDIC